MLELLGVLVLTYPLGNAAKDREDSVAFHWDEEFLSGIVGNTVLSCFTLQNGALHVFCANVQVKPKGFS